MDGGPGGASTPQSPTPARAAVDVVALTTHDDFLLEIGATLGGQASVNPVESSVQALERMAGARCPQVLMIDGRDVSDARAEVDAVQTKAPRASIVVFAAEGSEQSISDSLRGTSVFAVLPLPVDAAKTAAIFEGAVAEAKTKHSEADKASQPAARVNEGARGSEAGMPRAESLAVDASASRAQPLTVEVSAPVGHASAPSSSATEPPSEGGGRRYTMQIVLGGVAAVILGGGVIAYMSKDKAPLTPQTPAAEQQTDAAAVAETTLPAVETSLVKGKVDDLLEKARLAMRERRYAEPAGDNALLYYRSAVATDAASAEALDGLNRIAGVLAGRFEDALNDSKLDEAATALAQFKNAIPEDARVATFQQQLTNAQVSKAMADGNLDRAAALVRAAQQNNLMAAPQITRWRSEISRLQDEVRAKRVADQAARDAAAAAEQKKIRDARAAATAEAERQAQAERDKAREEQAKAEQAALAAREASVPVDTNVKRTPGSLQSILKRKRYVAPDYPADALARQLGGTVIVEFTVNTEGEPRDIRVQSAEPKGVFDRAAIAAVRRWRYEPPVVSGAPTEVPVRMSIRFAPPE